MISALTNFGKRIPKLMIDNSPVILTAIGVTGTLTTAYLTGRATFKAAEVLAYAEKGERLGAREPIAFREKLELCWKFYIPPAISVTLTVASIITANRVGSRRAAALASAFVTVEKAFEEYRSKVVEKMGEKKEEAVRAEIAQDRVKHTPVDREVIIAGNGSVLCLDLYSGRYFISDMETIKKAENDINYEVIHNMYASLSDLYVMLGLSPTSMSDEVGWNVNKMLDIKITTSLTEDGRPVLCIDYTTALVRGFHQLD